MTDSSTPSRAPGPVHRAFALLQVVVAAGEPVGVRELSRRTGLARSTTARLLATLAELGMVERTASGAAFPGTALATLSPADDGGIALLRDRLRPLVLELVEEFGESATVGVDDGDHFLYLTGEASPSPIQVPDSEGQSYPFHIVAPGLVAMASWPRDRLDRYLAGPLEASTEHSVTDPGAVRGRLEQIRADGYAWTDQELDVEVNGLAAPIHHDGRLVAVVSVFGPAYRHSPAERPDAGPRLAEITAVRGPALLGTGDDPGS